PLLLRARLPPPRGRLLPARDQKGIFTRVILNLISGPRNVSMAFMYSFAQRSDTEVVDEPFYAVYLAKTGAAHPGAAEVLQALPADEERVKEKLAAPRDKPVLFLKNMAHHLEVLREPLLPEWTNIF